MSLFSYSDAIQSSKNEELEVERLTKELDTLRRNRYLNRYQINQ